MAERDLNRKRRNKLPRDIRAKFLVDETSTDNGVFYHCGNCGFLCNDKRDSLGGNNSGSAINHSDFTTQSAGIMPGVPQTAITFVACVQTSIAGVALNSSGNAKTVVHNHRAVVSGGCPLCGSLNWRGDFP